VERVSKETRRGIAMTLGTHNSATGGQLLWWLRPLAWLINPTSKCQDRTIADQLADGVKVFNLQVAYVNGKWRFTHGLAIYKEDVFETLAMMKACATKDEPIYFQLYLDKCFWCQKDEVAFIKLCFLIIKEYLEDEVFMMFDPWVEGTNEHFRVGNVLKKISLEEHYWTMGWAKTTKKWYNYIPLPKRHAKKFNKEYKDNCKSKYLMLDFYEY
jgi:hypothetical protein